MAHGPSNAQQAAALFDLKALLQMTLSVNSIEGILYELKCIPTRMVFSTWFVIHLVSVQWYPGRHGGTLLCHAKKHTEVATMTQGPL